jgi:hypothetical protein
VSDSPAVPPRSSGDVGDALSFGLPVLELVAPLAGLGLVAVIAGRALAPSIAGAGVGMDGVIRAAQYLGGLSTQLCGIVAIVLGLAELLVVRTSRLPRATRSAALVLGGVVILGCFFASSRTEGLSLASRAALGVSASLVALLGARRALRAPFARGPALVVGLVCLGSLLRLGAAAIAYQAANPRWARLLPLEHGLSTVGFLVGALGVATATAWVAGRSRGPASPITLGVLFAALLITRQALLASRDDAGPGTVLLGRALGRLVTQPAPLIPASIQLFVAALAPLIALVALFRRDVPPREGADPSAPRARLPSSLGAVVALSLLVRDTPEMPLGALFLVIAGLSVALTAEDDRAVWASISAGSR